MNAKPSIQLNVHTWISVAVFGAVIALSGITHGVFELMQGNKITETFIIQSIAPENQRWLNGEEAFTLLHNFLVTGIAAVLVSLVIIYWSLFQMKKPYGPPIFIMLYILLTLVGGGIAHVLFFFPVWLFSRMIRKELSWRKKNPSSVWNKLMSSAWLPMLLLSCILFISALIVSFTGIKDSSDETISMIIYSSLLAGLVLLNLTFLAALTRDIGIKA